MIKRLFLLTIFVFPFFMARAPLAQEGVAGFTPPGGTVTGYGQAFGGRRSQVRPLVPYVQPTQTFNQQGLPTTNLTPSAQQGFITPGGTGPSFFGGVNYQIHVLGVVAKPGTYRVPPSTRLDEALATAGGISERGSSRRLEIRREKEGTKLYDLLKFQREGDLNQNPFLLDNDVIFVPFVEKSVQIEGPVKRNGIYEVVREETFWDVVQLAGGYTTGVSVGGPVKVIRFVNGEKKVLEIENGSNDLSHEKIQNGDVIVVPHLFTAGRKFDYNLSQLPNDNVFYPSFNDNIFVIGAVSQPGAYPYNPHYNIRDFINMSGPLRDAKLKRSGIISSSTGKFVHEQNIASLSPGDIIIVPQKHWTMDNTIKWYNTFANSIITGFTLRELIRR